jgi:hypothetical protein
MINFYKIENGFPVVGTGIKTPKGFKEYSLKDVPQDLTDALQFEREQQNKTSRIAELQQLLRELDIKRVRPLAEGDTEYLETLNARVIEFRTELRALE